MLCRTRPLFLLLLLPFLSGCMKAYYRKHWAAHQYSESRCRQLTEAWIKRNASDSSAYRSIWYSEMEESARVAPRRLLFFRIMRTVPGSANYSMTHRFVAADSSGKPVTQCAKFIYSTDFTLRNFYYTTNDSCINDYMRDSSDWKRQFGR